MLVKVIRRVFKGRINIATNTHLAIFNSSGFGDRRTSVIPTQYIVVSNMILIMKPMNLKGGAGLVAS